MAEVEGVIGFPPGHFDDHGNFEGGWSEPDRRFGNHEEYWSGPRGQISVVFDINSFRVLEVFFDPPGNFLDRWLDQWHTE